MEGEEGGRNFLCSHLKKRWCYGPQTSPMMKLTMSTPILHTRQILHISLMAPYTKPVSLPKFPYHRFKLFHLHFLLSNLSKGSILSTC